MKRQMVSGSIRVAIACVLAPGWSTAPPATAEIFKCVERSGVDRYQNFPCSIDSPGSLPAPRKTSATPLTPGAATVAVRGGSVVPGPAQAASTAKPANTKEPAVGMTQAEVRSIWGEPEETDQNEIKEGRIEIWRYADGRSVHFNRRHRVLEVQR